MTTETINAMETKCARIVELKALKAATEKELKALEGEVKSAMNAAGETDMVFGSYAAKLSHVDGGLTVDTDALKADGLYEKYSKPKADYDRLVVTGKAPAEDNP